MTAERLYTHHSRFADKMFSGAQISI